MSIKERKNLVCIAKTKAKQSKFNAREYYKFYTFFDTDTDEVIIASGSADERIYLFDIVELTYKAEKSDSWILKYDGLAVKNLMGAGIILNKPLNAWNINDLPPKVKIIRSIEFYKHGHYQKEYDDLIRLRDCEFYDGYIRTQDGLIFKTSDFPTNPPFMHYFNQINQTENPIKGGFEIQGKLDVIIRKSSKTKAWEVGYRFNGHGSTLKIISYELDDLIRAEKVAINDQKYGELVRWAKRRLEQDKEIMGTDELLDKAKELGITIINPDDLLEKVTFKPDYKKSFFTFLREKAEKTYYSSKGFFFILKNGRIVWEMPKYGASTYVFKKQDPHLLMQRLKITMRSKIYSDDQVGSLLQFIGRRRHPQSDERHELFEENWQERVGELAGF